MESATSGAVHLAQVTDIKTGLPQREPNCFICIHNTSEMGSFCIEIGEPIDCEITAAAECDSFEDDRWSR